MRILIVFTLIVFAMTATLVAQEKEQKLSKKEKKELRKKEGEEAKQAMLAVVRSKQFVIEAYSLRDRYGQSLPLNAGFNFIGVVDSLSLVQLSFEGLTGWNGLGGVTIEGRIKRFDVDEGKPNKPFSVMMRVVGRSGGWTDLSFSNAGGNSTEVLLTTNDGGRVTFVGNIVPLAASRVFQGISTN